MGIYGFSWTFLKCLLLNKWKKYTPHIDYLKINSGVKKQHMLRTTDMRQCTWRIYVKYILHLMCICHLTYIGHLMYICQMLKTCTISYVWFHIHVCSVRKAHFLSFKTYVMFDTHSLSFTALVMFTTCILFHLKCLYCLRHAISVIQNINNVHNTHSYYNAFCTSQ